MRIWEHDVWWVKSRSSLYTYGVECNILDLY